MGFHRSEPPSAPCLCSRGRIGNVDSGIDAIALADQLIRAGEFEIVVAGGMESMTHAPHLLPSRARASSTATSRCVDSMAYDGLWDVFTDQAMGALTEACNAELGHLARGAGRVLGPVAPARGRGVEERPVRRRGRPGRDPAAQGRPDGRSARTRASGGDTTAETPRPAAAGLRAGRHDHGRLRLADLRRRRRGRGDEQGQGRGARADLAGRDRRPRRRGRARLDAADAAGQAIRKALRQGGHRPGRPRPGRDQRGIRRRGHRRRPRSSASTEELVNVNGGAIALGHPIGMSGARIVLHLALELARRGGGIGAAALCGGGGQGDALIVRVPSA